MPVLLGLLIIVTVELITGSGSPPALVQAAGWVDSPSVTVSSEEASAAHELLRMINDERARSGAPPLAWNDELAQAAQAHTQLMAERNQLSHDLPGEPPLKQRLAQTSLRLDRSGENVGYDSSIPGAHEGFMHSPLHRENLLNPNYNQAGIGVVHRGNMFYVTEDFAHILPVMSDAGAQTAIESSLAQLRRSAGEPLLRRVDDSRVQQLACAMARNDNLDTRGATALPRARYVVAYTANEPAKLSSDVIRLRNARDVDRYALGLCFARTPKFPNGVYWVLMVFFAPGRGTAAETRSPTGVLIST